MNGKDLKVFDKEIQPNRPAPIIENIDVVPYKRRMEPQVAIDALIDGHFVLVSDFYSSGLSLLSELKYYIKKKYSKQSFKGQRDSRAVFRELSNRILLMISENELKVRKSPEIGWLKILYPELDKFLLPFPQVQGLNSAWQWYLKGISIPVLDNIIHPYFGTYFPTRFEHLNLFDEWLAEYNGSKESAFDVGVGCGVLSFQMLKHGFRKVIGTDSNPNAIIGLNELMAKDEVCSNLLLFHGDLFANCETKSELIVFNPPWLPASHDVAGLDNAIYYGENLFPRFFEESEKHLKPNGRVVVLFSNLAHITKVTVRHPIEDELSKSGRFQKELFLQKNVALASKKTKRHQHWRGSEMVELWELKRSIAR